MFNNTKLNFKLSDVIRAAFGLAMIDGGFVIAIQIITFLMNYFGANIQISPDSTQPFSGINKTNFLISIIGMLNLSVIIYRITGLARGMKYSPVLCYQHALRRWPILILLYMVGSILLLLIAVPIIKFINALLSATTMDFNNVIMFCMLALIPYGILACIFVIDQEKNPIQAIISTFTTIKYRISIRLLFSISMLYALPLSINSLMINTYIAPYLGLFNAVWFLFCHILIIVIYTGANLSTKTTETKPTKVIIV